MWAGVGKSGSPRLKSNTLTPAARSWRALAPAAIVADGLMDEASFEIGIMSVGTRGGDGRRKTTIILRTDRPGRQTFPTDPFPALTAPRTRREYSSFFL